MKKIFGVALVLALALTLCFSSVALAQDPTDADFHMEDVEGEVTASWSGSGHVWGNVTAGDDAATWFDTWGDTIAGSFTLTDDNSTPGGVGNVDTISSYIDADVTNGIIEYRNVRTDTDTAFCPNSGQVSYSFIGTGWYTAGLPPTPGNWNLGTGTAEMATGSASNDEEIVDDNYLMPQTLGGYNFEAAGYYTIIRSMEAGDGDFAGVWAEGNGTATMDCLSSFAGSASYDLAALAYAWPCHGTPYYWDSPFNATGPGTFILTADSHDEAKIPFNTHSGSTSGGITWVATGGLDFGAPRVIAYGDSSPGSANLTLIANFTSSFSMPNYTAVAK